MTGALRRPIARFILWCDHFHLQKHSGDDLTDQDKLAAGLGGLDTDHPRYADIVPVADESRDGLLADWRFLQTIPDRGRALVVGGPFPDLESVFDVSSLDDLLEGPESSKPFQLIVMTQSNRLPAIKGRLDPNGGRVVFGVPSMRIRGWRFGWLGLRVAWLRHRLRDSGLIIDGVYGTLPDPWVPEYVFPLAPVAARFALERFLLSRRPAWRWTFRALQSRAFVRMVTAVVPGALVVCRGPEE